MSDERNLVQRIGNRPVNTEEKTDDTALLAFAVADQIAVDAKGYCWRTWHDNDHWSMCPVNPDNSPIPHPVTWFIPQAEVDRLRAELALKDEVLNEIRALANEWRRRAAHFGRAADKIWTASAMSLDNCAYDIQIVLTRILASLDVDHTDTKGAGQ